MHVSYKWLQKYFKETLPAPEELADILTMKVLEVDGIEKYSDDSIIDVNVLPDRARYCLSHRGIASEIHAATGLSFSLPQTDAFVIDASISTPSVRVEEQELCSRYMARVIDNVAVSASPEWLVTSLEAIGQHSINSVVDAANYVMFDMGQPLHAFDANKIEGEILVRRAKEGETIRTLDDREVTLSTDILVIADEAGPLAIAGIKGGMRAAVTEHTKKIVLEAAHFHAGSTRKSSVVLGIRTDASKRFENDLTPEFAPVAIDELTSLILQMSPEAGAGEVTDVYPTPETKHSINIEYDTINRMLGITIPQEEIVSLLKRLRLEVSTEGEHINIVVPFERRDLQIPEDVVEEVGRLYGYEKLSDDLPPDGFPVVPHQEHMLIEKVRDSLVEQGFSEVYLYTLVAEGEYEVVVPLASDKGRLRTNLHDGLTKALSENARIAPLLGLDEIRMFEVGKVFSKEGEEYMLSLGIEAAVGTKIKGIAEKLDEVIVRLLNALNLPLDLVQHFEKHGNVAEISLKMLLKDFEVQDDLSTQHESPEVHFNRFSQFPFVLRDVAVWVDQSVEGGKSKVEELIRSQAGELLQNIRLVDEYPKDGRTSYAYRLVFQARDKTLTDEEVNQIMEKVYESLASEQGFEIR